MRQEYVHTHAKWFAKDAADVTAKLESDSERGLSAAEARARLARFGPNQLPAPQKAGALRRFLRHFHDILIYILLVCAFVTLMLGHYADTVVILAVALLNAAIGFFQESKAEKALEDIRQLLSLKAEVIRDGQRQEIDAAELTLGDIVLLEPGDKIPADLRLLKANNLTIEEAALTGESVPADKDTAALDPDTPLGDRTNQAFSGSTVSAGTGLGIVVAIGRETELGHISQLLAATPPLTTPLIREMRNFGKTISLVVIGIAAAVYAFGHFLRDYPAQELLLSSIGLAIAAIPEGLPAILSIILAIGVQNMAKRRAIVRNLPSVETLGAVSVICSDKTGTLTKNEMTVQTVAVHEEIYAVTGAGYAPQGEILAGANPAELAARPDLRLLLTAFRVCNDAALSRDEHDLWQVQGNPTEGALLALYAKSGLDAPLPERLYTIPFASEYKYMATLVEGEEANLIFIKGAPDRLLEMAELEQRGHDAVPVDRAAWTAVISQMADKGQRILGAAMAKVDKSVTAISHADLQNNVIFLGLAGIMDPPREEAVQAIRLCQEAGITVKMITGDHLDTAKAIGAQMGIGDGKCAVSGAEIEEMSPEQLAAAARQSDIFARTSPEHKLKLVAALQSDGHICAMTGDGVNDAPALKMADVGVAMGIKGTEVTKDAAEIVLADDNFSSIAAAVEEGRRVYDNLKKTILFILPTNGAESFLIIAAILFGVMIPLTPVQILWVNMVTSVTVSLALAFEPVEAGAMRRKPRPAGAKLLSGYFIWRILFVSVLIGGLTLLLNVILLGLDYDIPTVRTATLQAIVMCQLFHLFNSRSIRASALEQNPLSNKAVPVVAVLMLVLQAAVTYLPVMNRIFGTVPLSFGLWLAAIALGAIVFAVVEGEKYLMRRRDARRLAEGKPLAL